MSQQGSGLINRSSTQFPLTQIEPNVWEVPKNFQSGMKVPARIYADEDLLSKMRTDRTIQQCVNVAHLDGICKYAITMPDGHEGYGFPIGGVAATDHDEGLISPGGVGYDINCIRGSSLILSDFGYKRPIFSPNLDWKKEGIKCIGKGMRAAGTGIVRFVRQKPNCKVFRVRTLGGHEIDATEDHPFLTPLGMVELGKLGKSKVAVFPFSGVEFEQPKKFTLVSKEMVASLRAPVNIQAVIRELEKRQLLPLTSENPKLPYLLKILGFSMGDGSLTLTPKTHGVWFYGKKEDLEKIQHDVKQVGFKPSRIYSRVRKHHITTKYST